MVPTSPPTPLYPYRVQYFLSLSLLGCARNPDPFECGDYERLLGWSCACVFAVRDIHGAGVAAAAAAPEATVRDRVLAARPVKAAATGRSRRGGAEGASALAPPDFEAGAPGWIRPMADPLNAWYLAVPWRDAQSRPVTVCFVTGATSLKTVVAYPVAARGLSVVAPSHVRLRVR